MKARITLIFLAAALLVATCTEAQVMGPILERHTLEIGVTYKWYDRDFESTYIGQEDWSAGAIYFKWGACRWATFDFEGGISTVSHDDFPDNNYRRYTFGGGITARLYRGKWFDVGLSGHYSEIFDHDRSDNQLHKNTRNITSVLQIEKEFDIRDQRLTVWGGPAFVFDQSRQYPWGSSDPIRDETSNNFGFVVGLNAVVFDRLALFANGVYADAFQPRLGAGVEF
jgi:hypothetical protein